MRSEGALGPHDLRRQAVGDAAQSWQVILAGMAAHGLAVDDAKALGQHPIQSTPVDVTIVAADPQTRRPADLQKVRYRRVRELEQ